jgi:hypothetical protein
MPKKKVTQTEGPAEAPVNQGFSEVGAAQEAVVAASGQTAQTTANQTQIPADVQELIRSTLSVVMAQRKTYGLATTLTSLTRAVNKALDNYLRLVPKYAVRELVKNQLAASGYTVVTAVVEYGGALYQAEVVILYKDYHELVEMVKAGRLSGLIKPLILTEGIDPLYDQRIKESAYV